MTRRQLVALLPYLPRAGRTSALPVATATAGALLLAASRFEAWGSPAAMATLRLAAVVLCAAAALTLDDEAASTLAASPTTLRRRRGARVVLAVIAVAAAWVALVAGAGWLVPEAASACFALFRGPQTLELAALLAVTLLAASVAARRVGPTTAGITGGGAAALAFLGAEHLPRRWTLLADGPLDAASVATPGRLTTVAVTAALLTLWAARDPWQRRLWTREPHRTVVTAAVGAVLIAVSAAVLLRTAAAPVTLGDPLATHVTDLAAAQGIGQLAASVVGPEMQWSHRIGGLDGAVDIGMLSIAVVGETVDAVQVPVAGTATPHEVEVWTRRLVRTPGRDLSERLARASAPGTANSWLEVDPAMGPSPTRAVTEARYLAATDTTVVVMTGDVTPPCGIAIADQLAARLVQASDVALDPSQA